MKEILIRKNSRQFLAKFFPLRYYMSLWKLTELWWMNQKCLELRWGRTIDQK
jgi:hypothetical protein